MATWAHLGVLFAAVATIGASGAYVLTHPTPREEDDHAGPTWAHVNVTFSIVLAHRAGDGCGHDNETGNKTCDRHHDNETDDHDDRDENRTHDDDNETDDHRGHHDENRTHDDGNETDDRDDETGEDHDNETHDDRENGTSLGCGCGDRKNDTGGSGWITLNLTMRTIDLVAPGNLTELLGLDLLPPGCYTQLRIVVDSATGVMADGTAVNFTVPSGVLKLRGPFAVGGNETLSLAVNLSHIIHESGAGDWKLGPVLGQLGTGERHSHCCR